VYVYKCYRIFEGDENVYKFASSINGKVIDSENQLVVSTWGSSDSKLKELKDLKHVGNKQLFDLPVYLQKTSSDNSILFGSLENTKI